MDVFRIEGGVRLGGTVAVSGSKNAALPIMAASLLAGGPVRLANVPRLADVDTLSAVIEGLGLDVARDDRGDVHLETIRAHETKADERLVRRMRAAFCVLGPLVARRGKAVVPLPGGCHLGDRPVDLHLRGIAALGANVRLERGYVMAEAQRLRGASIDLMGPRGPTVTGTANTMAAAVLARGVSLLHGAATEPEIVDLGRFLNALGARIEGLGTPTLEIHGVDELGGGAHRVIPDRIEAGTLLIAVAVAGGSALVERAPCEHLGALVEKLRAAGAAIKSGADWLSIRAEGRPRSVDYAARPYPDVPTDLQAQWMALASRADGVSRVADHVFPERFFHVGELRRLGACILRRGSSAVVQGVPRLAGADLEASDLRASAALVLAGLAADGETIVHHVHHLDRGYERLERKLAGLGARIERCCAPGDRRVLPARGIATRPHRRATLTTK